MPQIKIAKIIRSKRKSIALVISSDATLIVRAPFRASLDYIEKMTARKINWIERKIKEIQNRPKAVEKHFVAGEEFLYFGEKYQLKITGNFKIELSGNSETRLRLASGGLHCAEAELRRGEGKELYFPKVFLWRAKKRMESWYKKQALEEISARVKIAARKLNLNYRSIKISNAKTNWGLCGPKNSLNFSWRLIMAPEFIVDYVIIHELTHILEKNHSRKFWNKVEAVMPEYKRAKKWLRENGKALVV